MQIPDIWAAFEALGAVHGREFNLRLYPEQFWDQLGTILEDSAVDGEFNPLDSTYGAVGDGVTDRKIGDRVAVPAADPQVAPSPSEV